MSHWAEIDSKNKVVRVVVGNNDESDEGYKWIVDNLGGKWIQTSYNAEDGVQPEWLSSSSKFKARNRKNFASIGYTYDEVNDVFIPPKPYSSWILNEDTCKWEPPVDYPSDDKVYEWREAVGNDKAGWYLR